MTGRITFLPINYWNKNTMELGDKPTNEQWKQVENICHDLNVKYRNETGCFIHPEQIHSLVVGIHNDYIDIQAVKHYTCQCQKVSERLIEIRNIEIFALNPNHFKDTH